MSEKILVLVKHLDELEPTRALLAALPERAFALSFSQEDLRTRFGETAHDTNTDPLHYLLSVHEISCVVCFSGAREFGPTSNYLQLSYFDEVGIPTIELQRDLLRCPERARNESAARHYLPWSGPSGTGYLKLARPTREAGALRDDVVLITSHLAHSPYSEEQRYQFAFAVMRLAREHPQLTFLWRASAAEEQSAEASTCRACSARRARQTFGSKTTSLSRSSSCAPARSSPWRKLPCSTTPPRTSPCSVT